MASFNLVYLFTLLSFINFIMTKSQEDNYLWSYFCSENLTTPNSAFQSNVRTLLSDLSSNAKANQFYKTTVGSTNQSDTVYGMFYCSGDVPPEICTQCIANATKAISSGSFSNCSITTVAEFQYEECVVRFSNSSFFSTPDFSSLAGSCSLLGESSDSNLIMNLASKTMKQVAEEAANNPIGAKKYATKQERISGLQTLYCQAQCTPDLSPQNCRKCLNFIKATAQNCLPRFDNIRCRMKCDFYPFYRPNNISPPPTEPIPVFNTDSQDLTHLFQNCSSNKSMIDSTYLWNRRSLLSFLSSNSMKTNFNKTSVDKVSGLFMCRGDISLTLCHQCVVNATQRISSGCPSSTEAIIWYNHCLLRYSYSDLSSLSTLDTTPTYDHFNINNTTNPSLLQSFFTWTLVNTLPELDTVTEGSPNKNYGTKEVPLNHNQTLYTLAQCTPDLSNSDCRSCLDNIFGSEIPWCCMASPEGKVLYPSCYIMFGLSKFYGDDAQIEPRTPASAPPTTPGNKKDSKQTIILIVVPIVVSAILLSLCCYLRRRKTRKNKYKTLLRKNFGQESITLEGLQFDLTIIKAATNNFSHQNKIGKGGFGEVYKGILYDGRQIAVKRLSTKSKQGSIEFENEILLIAKLQHKNLVALIGFCIEEQEKILIYEYMMNGSLDYLLFGTQQRKLSWSERYKIIEGSALGILYLHEYSRLKVIHRDLKPSNVLLDENMNPKISDFGMARIVEMDQDRGNTNRIAGTYGYMSPEYAMLGEFSEKSDIFSFGVMVLEIITGKKNVNFYESHSKVEGVIGYVWRQWKNQEPLSIMDSHIKESYSQIEVLKCIHISLLCVQENPNVRPTMAIVISYLNNHTLELPSPQEPAFFRHRCRMSQEIITQQESSSNQVGNDFPLLSVNEMSMSDFYPR